MRIGTRVKSSAPPGIHRHLVSATPVSTPGPPDLLEELNQPGDRLLYRPGRRPRVHKNRTWTEAEPEILSTTAYQELRARLLHLSMPLPEDIRGTGSARRIKLADGRTLALEIVGAGLDEAMWLRAVDFTPADEARLKGDLHTLNEVLAQTPGIVLIGGVDLDSARELLHAVLSLGGAHQDATLLLASSDATYRIGEEEGAVLRVVPDQLRKTLRIIEPHIVALDPAVSPGEIALEELEPAPRIIAGVVGPDAASLLPRWLARLARRDSQRARACLATTPIGVVTPAGVPSKDGSLRFIVYRLAPRERQLALSGKTAALSATLAKRRARPAKGGLHLVSR